MKDVLKPVRHPTGEERAALAGTITACGFKETLSVIASLLANEVPDVNLASDLRIELSKFAVKVGKVLGEEVC